MALSRTARILIAILLLAAAAFFWVNYFTQSRQAESPAQDPLAVAPTAPSPVPAAPAPTADADAEPADGEGEAGVTDAEPGTEAEGAAVPPATPTPDATVAPAEPPVVVVDAPVAVTREVVIADLPFLITSPQPIATDTEAEAEDAAEPEAVTVPTRATVNPFSPVVVRTPPAPERDVPAPSVVVGEVAIPEGPPTVAPVAAPAPVRASAPTPRAVAPAPPAPTGLTRELPTGAVLASTPGLLREPRVGTVADRVDLPSVTAVAIPAPEPAVAPLPVEPRPATPEVDLEPVAAIPDPPAAPDAVDAGDVPDTVGTDPVSDATDTTDTTDVADATSTPDDTADRPVVNGTAPGPAPLAAGSTRLARYLRDADYVFTGSVLGPVSVGVFRSQVDPAPIVVALGQTLPNTDIVLTDLRGMQAELTLGDTTQILTLDLRR